MKLIIDMPMPKNCAECLFVTPYSRCVFLGDYAIDESKRADKCPIKGVLPDEHGDLIDRDETFHAAQPQGCTDEHWAETTLGRVVLGAKTVIAAERIDDEQIH